MRGRDKGMGEGEGEGRGGGRRQEESHERVGRYSKIVEWLCLLVVHKGVEIAGRHIQSREDCSVHLETPRHGERI